MSDPTDPVVSPPPSDRPVEASPPDARDRLMQLAHALTHSRDARLLREYLRLRLTARV